MQWTSQLTEIHARGDRALSDTTGAIHEVRSVLKLAVPVHSGAIGQLIENIHHELIAAVHLNKRAGELA